MEATLSATISGVLTIVPPLLLAIFAIVQTWNGLVLPVVIDFINQHVANPKLRVWIAFFICMAVASILNYQEVLSIRNATDAAFMIGKISFIFAQAHLVYKNFYEKSDLRVQLFGPGISK